MIIFNLVKINVLRQFAILNQASNKSAPPFKLSLSQLRRMHQTKIAQFFKKTSETSPSKSPSKAKLPQSPRLKQKKLNFTKSQDEKIEKPSKNSSSKDDKNNKSKTEDDSSPSPTSNSSKNKNGSAKNSSIKNSSKIDTKNELKRKISAIIDSSSDEEEEKRIRETKIQNKKLRRRIVVEDSSSEEDNISDKKADSIEITDEEIENGKEKKTKLREPEESKLDVKNKNKIKSDSNSENEEVEMKEVGEHKNGKKLESADDDAENLNSKNEEKYKSSKSESDNEEKEPSNLKVAKKSQDKKTDKTSKSSKTAKSKADSDTSQKLRKGVKPIAEHEAPQVSTFFTSKSSKASSTSVWDNSYDPAKANYHPINDASWKRGEKVPYLALAKTLEAIEATSSRLKNIETLGNYFRSVLILSPDDMIHSIYLCLNKLAPAYEGIELGIADTNIMKAIAQATGRSLERIKADAGEQGDLGLVAELSRSNQRTLLTPLPLTITSVFNKLKEIAGLSGTASTQKKISLITSMLVSCKHSESRYLVRSLAGKLRIGLAEQSLLQSIASACFLTPPNQDQVNTWPPPILNAGKKMSPEGLKGKIDEEAFKLKSAFCECPNYEILVEGLLKEGTDNLSKYCKLTPGIPPRPMLAQPTKGIPDVLQRFDGIKFTSEYKYDGERAQVHLLEDGSVKIFSRNQEDNTGKYPDIVNRFSSCIKGKVESCILDSEAVAWDIEKEMILPFQVLSTRKRKDANEAEIKVQVQLFAFDLIYLNGKSLVKEPLIERRRILHENFEPVKGQFAFATSLDTDSIEELQEFLDESIKGNCEGLMVKTLDVNASYELAKRSQKWLKLKKDYLESGGDSLDLVVIGGFLGKGKRVGTYGGFLLACYNADDEEFQTICKLGTGFSDEDLQEHSERLKPHIIKAPKSYFNYHNNLTPDHWFEPTQVWEIKCADLSLSPVHKAAIGLVDGEKGISLRFPRFLRIRDDKGSEDATSAAQVADLYKNQEVVKNNTKNKEVDEDDFY